MNMLTVIPAVILATAAAAANGQAIAANGPQGMRMCPATATLPTVADRAMADWRKKRALYLHDLRLSSLEQKETPPPARDYKLGTALIDADLYLSYAEADGLIDGRTKAGRHDLQKAVTALKSADKMVGKRAEKARIERFKHSAVALGRDFEGCMSEETPNEREQYRTLRKALGRMIHQMG